MDSNIYHQKENPEKNAGFVSKVFMWWLRDLIWKGYNGTLTEDDLFTRADLDASAAVASRLERNWETELARAEAESRKPSLFRALLKTFWKRSIVHGIAIFLGFCVLRIFEPICLSKVVQFFYHDYNVTHREASIYASVLIVSITLRSFLLNHTLLDGQRLGMRIRLASCSLMYRKILRLDKQSLDSKTTGEIFNLMTNDVARFDLVSCLFHFVWLAFVQTPIVTYFVYQYVTWCAFVGLFFVILLTLPVQTFLGKLSVKFRNKVAVRTDQRINLMSEVLNGMFLIKTYAWENPFAKIITGARKSEIGKLVYTLYLKGFMLASGVFVERSGLFVTLFAYWLAGNVAPPDQVFAMAQFFNIWNATLAMSLSFAVANIGECKVSIERIQNFLTSSEVKIPEISDESPRGSVSLTNASASWDENHQTLNNVSWELRSGELCAIVGAVGSGKSSLLNVVLGELALKTGSMSRCGTIAYYSQIPWVFVGTIKQNILFGQPFEVARYMEVLKVCALETDLQLMPHGDQTFVGEKGISLSGGQKARLSLARAVYREADIYVLDDPLSAVDAKVGKHIFEKCISQFLRNKTRILVTHQVQYLEKADTIVVLKNGEVEAQGKYDDLSSSNILTDIYAVKEENENVKGDGSQEVDKDRKDNEDNTEETTEKNETSQLLEKEDTDLKDADYKEKTECEDPLKIIVQYFRAGGSVVVLIILATFLILGQVASSSCDYVVAIWTSAERESKDRKIGTGQASEVRTNVYITIYGCLVLSCILLTFGRSAFFFKICLRASRRLHDSMLMSILKAPMRFFDTNPAGRVLNRFSKDMGILDEVLPPVMMHSIQSILVMVGIVTLVMVGNYLLIFPTIAIGCIFLWLSKLFVRTGRSVKTLEAVKRSPVYTHVSDTLSGLSTIRASNKMPILMEEFDGHQDRHTSAWFLYMFSVTGLGLWLDLICVVYTIAIIATFLSFNYDDGVGANVGLAISQCLILVGMLEYAIVQANEVISYMTSVERILEYTKITPEKPVTAPRAAKLSHDWPSGGNITFKSVGLKYKENGPYALDSVNFSITSKQKIGIVGRTGSGKTSLVWALLRLAHLDGVVTVDGLDTTEVDLHHLRKRISILPQDPCLFSLPLRFNLDPLSEYRDEKIWSALEEVQLKSAVKSLDMPISEGGSNFSVGQRQLICLARTLLRNNVILILDEATASVDQSTDEFVQKTIREKFQNCTVLTIAHRLNTIMDSDKVMVMDSGKLVEFDHPYALIQNDNGYLTKLIHETGEAMSEILKKTAENKFHSNTKGRHESALSTDFEETETVTSEEGCVFSDG